MAHSGKISEDMLLQMWKTDINPTDKFLKQAERDAQIQEEEFARIRKNREIEEKNKGLKYIEELLG